MQQTARDHAVIIAGGGPTGLMLAGELKLAGIDVLIVERRATQDVDGSRAGGLHARTLEILDQRGLAERFIAQGQRHPAVFFHLPLAITDLPTRHNYTLALWQGHTERLLAEWVGSLGVPVLRERTVTGFVQDADGVTVELAGEDRPRRAAYLVGCDGGRSRVRKAAAIEFPGWEPRTSWLIAEVEMTETPPLGFRHDALGTHAIGTGEMPGRFRAVLTEAQLQRGSEPSLQEVRDALRAAFGTDFGAHRPHWISRFTDGTRQAATYRDRRVLLAGDAAHVHPPLGGQGLNLGVQDAVNLGWKLAQVLNGQSAANLLDTYHAERHPAGARVLQHVMAQVALRRPDPCTQALGHTLSALFALDEPRRHVAAQLSGLSVHYDLGAGHPLLGRRMPDLELLTANGRRRVFTLLHEARPVLLTLGAAVDPAYAPWADRVRSLEANCEGPWVLPGLGPVGAPAAVLIRPDGYVAWVGDGTAAGLADALTAWVGPPAAAGQPA